MEGDKYMIGLLVFLLFILFARMLNERANKKLSIEKKAELVDVFSQYRIITFAVMIVILLAYFLMLKTELFSPTVIMIVYIGLLVAYISGYTFLAYKKLKNHDFPGAYIKTYLQSAVIRMSGIVMFLSLII